MTNQINSEAFEEVANWMEKHPFGYEQSTFGIRKDHNGIAYVELTCGSPCCVAGHLAALSGYDSSKGLTPQINLEEVVESYDPELDIDLSLSRNTSILMAVAQRNGGLSDDQKSILFGGGWPSEWFDEEESPLYMPLNGLHNFNRNPDLVGAIMVLRRIAKHGFESDKFPVEVE